MEYKPFLDMHLLVSDELLQALPALIQLHVLIFLLVVLAVLLTIWLKQNV